MLKAYTKRVAGWPIGALALTALIALLAIGCGRLGLEGDPIGNQPPELIFVNIPAGGTQFGANPTIYWFGTDPDGRIVRYDYAVVPESTVQRYLEEHGCAAGPSDAERFIQCADDEAFGWISIFVDSTGDQLPTQERVRLYASFDTLDCDSQVITIPTPDTVYLDTVAFNCVSNVIPQYMFIRAIDDLGQSSEVKYRSYMRDNHWPDTRISDDFRIASADSIRNAYYSLKELTVTYRGISFAYGGSDRGDYLRDEPPMEFFWRIYGPFPSRTRNLADTLLPDGSPREPVQSSVGPDERSGPWTTDTIGSIYGLWNKYDAINGEVDTTRSGWFMLVVTGRDDAFVPDPTPAVVAFKAIDPKFERDVLLIADGSWIIGHWATPTCRPLGAALDPSCSHETLKKVAQAAAGAVANNPSGWDFNQDWVEFNRAGCGTPQRPRCFADKFDPQKPNVPVIPVEVFAKHKLTIYCEDDINESMIGTQLDITLANYMDVGGKLWMISRIPFLPSTRIGIPLEPQTYDLSVGAVGRINRTYFDMEGFWFAGFQSGQKFPSPGVVMYSNDEFIGMNRAEGITSPLFPEYVPIDRAHVDSAYCQFLRGYLQPVTIIGAPGVPYAIRGSRSRTVYQFDSWRPSQNNADGAVILMRFVGPDRDTPIYKSAWFGCPPHWMDEAKFLQVVEGMTDWFLNQPIEIL
ncbi:MAG: hypothetical protein AB1752_10865 [Candidatus Zixiibacteriota bacterium]